MGHTLVGCSFINKPFSSSSLPVTGTYTDPHLLTAVRHTAGVPGLSVIINPSQDSLLISRRFTPLQHSQKQNSWLRKPAGMSLNLVVTILSVEKDENTVYCWSCDRAALTFVPFSSKSFMLALQSSSSSTSVRFSCSACLYFSFRSDSSVLVSSYCGEHKVF